MLLTLSSVFVAISIGFGVTMVLHILKKQRYSKLYVALHVLTVGVGAILVIIAALSGSGFLWPNIGLAVIVALLGVAVGFYKFHALQNRLMLLAVHAGLATICFTILLYNTFIVST